MFGGGLRSEIVEGGGGGSVGGMGGLPISVFSHASTLPVRRQLLFNRLVYLTKCLKITDIFIITISRNGESSSILYSVIILILSKQKK